MTSYWPTIGQLRCIMLKTGYLYRMTSYLLSVDIYLKLRFNTITLPPLNPWWLRGKLSGFPFVPDEYPCPSVRSSVRLSVCVYVCFRVQRRIGYNHITVLGRKRPNILPIFFGTFSSKSTIYFKGFILHSSKVKKI